MKPKILFSIFILAVTAIACVSEFDAQLPSDDVQVLIVDGTIMENTVVTFHLSKSFSLDLTIDQKNLLGSIPEKYFVTDAKLTIIGNDNDGTIVYQSSPAESMGKGIYQIYVGELVNNVKYGIQIEYDGDTYQSEPSNPLYTPEIDSVSWVQPEYEGPISFRISTHDDTEGAKFYLWNYKEDWEIRANYSTTVFLDLNPAGNDESGRPMYKFYSDGSRPHYYCWKKSESKSYLIGSTESLSENRIVNRQFFQGSPEDDRFSFLYSVIVYQQAISKNAFEYYQNKIKLNEEMGSLFTPQPSELNGNITCITDPSKKVMGYVEVVKNTTEKRIYLDADWISRPLISNCDLIPQDSVDKWISEGRYTSYAQFYLRGYRPANGMDMGRPGFPMDWSKSECTECTDNKNGGTKNKPDFWPNDHK